MRNREFERAAADQFETGRSPAGRLLREREEIERRGERGKPDESGFDRLRRGKQFQHGRGDHAERAFGADEQVLEVVSGIVLLQLVEAVPDPAVGERHFEAEHEVARDAVGKRGDAAGIGREIAADGAAALGAERQREQAAGAGGRVLRPREQHARLAGHGVRCRVDLADTVEPAQRQHDLAFERDLPAHQPGIAALRHDRRADLVRERQDRRHFADRARAQHHGGAPVIKAALLDQIAFLLRRVGDRMFCADDRRKTGDEVRRKRRAKQRVHERGTYRTAIGGSRRVGLEAGRNGFTSPRRGEVGEHRVQRNASRVRGNEFIPVSPSPGFLAALGNPTSPHKGRDDIERNRIVVGQARR